MEKVEFKIDITSLHFLDHNALLSPSLHILIAFSDNGGLILALVPQFVRFPIQELPGDILLHLDHCREIFIWTSQIGETT
jgi:hypothetical protein